MSEQLPQSEQLSLYTKVSLAAAGAVLILGGCSTNGEAPVIPPTVTATSETPQPSIPQPEAPQPGGTSKSQPKATPKTAGSACAFDSGATKTWAFNDLKGLNVAGPDLPIHNNEAQIYNDDARNVRVENGKLVLQARKENLNGQHYTSGRVDTEGQYPFGYGRLEACMKLPKGKGTWPAFWLLSDNQVHTGKIPEDQQNWETDDDFYKKDGEVDVMEAAGSHPGQVEATVHTYTEVTEGYATVARSADEFHKYGVIIAPKSVTFTVDGKQFKRVTKPADANSDNWPIGGGNKFYWIANLAMGGDMGGQIDNSNSKKWITQVDQVAYYKR
jgi:beta-glucanase (GH16 family)